MQGMIHHRPSRRGRGLTGQKTTARFREGVLDGVSSCSRDFPFIADLVGDLLREVCN